VDFRQADTLALDAVSDDRAVTKKVARVLSNTARGGASWFVCTCVLARISPQYRRAGREGLTAWALAEVTAAGLKALTDRPRPSGNDGNTSSSSMPSAHSAAAVAYAVASGSRVPIAGVPLGVLAGAVSWSRLSTRRHFPSDVAAGTLLGIATGAAVAVLSRHTKSLPFTATAARLAA